jgi:hypothetical protein
MKAVWVVAWLVAIPGCDGDDASAASDDGGSQPTAEPGAGNAGRSPEATDGGEPACTTLEGSYEALYTPLSGNCGPLSAPARVTLEPAAGASTQIQQLPAASVTTEIVVRACAARVAQVVTDAQTSEVVLRIDAELSVDDDGAITGTATATRFDAGVVECTGMYSVELRSASTTIGGAGVGGAGAPLDAGSGQLDGGLSADLLIKVQYDCAQTVQCNVQRGLDVPPDPIAACVEATAAYLQANPDRLPAYLDNFARCEPFVVCDYVTCTAAQP